MNILKKWLETIIHYFNKSPTPWGIGGGVNVMMESRQQVRQKQEQRERWESRYSEIVRKHAK